MSIFGKATASQENKPKDVTVPPRQGKIMLCRQYFNWYLERKGIPFYLEYHVPVHPAFSIDVLDFFKEVEKYYEEQDMIQKFASSLKHKTEDGK